MSGILVTGDTGVLGSKLFEELQRRGHEIFGVDLSHTHESNHERVDVSQFRQLERVFDRHGPFDIVYHTAAEFGRWNGEEYYEQLWQTNAIGTKNLIRLQERLGFKLVHFSSSEVYGDYPDIMIETVMDEQAAHQMNDYAMTKWVNEMQIENSRVQFGTETVRVRLFNTYGPGEAYTPFRSVNCRFCYFALTGQPITVYHGHHRTSTYISDTIWTLANIVDNFRPGEVYNIAGSEYHSMEALADVIWKLAEADESLIQHQPSELLTTKDKKVDTSKAIKHLGLKLGVPLEEGIKRTLEWMRQYYGIGTG